MNESENSQSTHSSRTPWWQTPFFSQVIGGLIVASVTGLAYLFWNSGTPLQARVTFAPYQAAPIPSFNDASRLLADFAYSPRSLSVEQSTDTEAVKLGSMLKRLAADVEVASSVHGVADIDLFNSGSKKISEIYIRAERAKIYAELVGDKYRLLQPTDRGLRIDELIPGERKRFVVWSSFVSYDSAYQREISIVYADGRAAIRQAWVASPFFSDLSDNWIQYLIFGFVGFYCLFLVGGYLIQSLTRLGRPSK